jgi:predicted GTPase
MGTWNGKKNSLDWHYNCVPPLFYFFEMAKNFISKKYIKYLKNEYNKPPQAPKQ